MALEDKKVLKNDLRTSPSRGPPYGSHVTWIWFVKLVGDPDEGHS